MIPLKKRRQVAALPKRFAQISRTCGSHFAKALGVRARPRAAFTFDRKRRAIPLWRVQEHAFVSWADFFRRD